MCLVKLAKLNFLLETIFYRLLLSYLMLDQLERDNLYEDFIYLNYDLGLICALFLPTAAFPVRNKR